jgi:hypothetical protein
MRLRCADDPPPNVRTYDNPDRRGRIAKIAVVSGEKDLSLKLSTKFFVDNYDSFRT